MNQADEWLEKHTRYDAEQWIAFVQEAIVKATKSPFTDVGQWLKAIAELTDESIPDDRSKFDENVRGAGVMGLVLVLWHLRVRRAKCYDPRRPVETRQKALREWRAYTHALLDAIADEELDPVFFQGQKWETPFAPEAGGKP